MKAFDAYLDRNARDGGFDMLLNRQLSREINGRLPQQFQEKQRLTVASNYFALACPIMPLGLLGAFMLLGGLDQMNQKVDSLTEADEVAQRDSDAAAIYMTAMRQKKEREREGKTSLACSRPLDLILSGKPTKEGRKPKDVEMQPEGKRSERITGHNLLSKSQNDTGKIVKQKMALEAHLEKMNGSGEQDYAMHCRVSSQLDLLEKALKKMGA